MKRILSIAGTLLAALACGRPPPSPPPKVASVEAGRIVLTAEAESRLGIPAGLVPVTRPTGPTRRIYPGDVMPAPGHATVLTAPHAGTVMAADGAGLPVAGTPVRAGQVLLTLSPLPALGERAQVATALSEMDAQVARARIQEQAAALALSRAQRLVADGLAGDKLLEEARAASASALATRQALESQQAALTSKTTTNGSATRTGLLAQTRIEAPFDGFLRDVRVAPHQHVASGTPLCEVVRRAALWVRVPVPSSQIATVATDSDALISDLSARPIHAPLRVAPVPHAPQTSQPGSGALDVYFVLPDAAPFRIGQRVAAWVAHSTASEAGGDAPDLTAIPTTALLYGPRGETWVYERSAPQTYLHRRVDVLRSEGAQVLLTGPSAPAVGAQLVTTGAAEIAGVEYGVGK